MRQSKLNIFGILINMKVVLSVNISNTAEDAMPCPMVYIQIFIEQIHNVGLPNH